MKTLLDYLRRSHGEDQPKTKITLMRKQTSEIKATDSHGRARTVQVEVRKKRVLMKRDQPEHAAEGEHLPEDEHEVDLDVLEQVLDAKADHELLPETAAEPEPVVEVVPEPEPVVEVLPEPEPVVEVVPEPVLESAPAVEAAPQSALKKPRTGMARIHITPWDFDIGLVPGARLITINDRKSLDSGHRPQR